MNPLLLLVLGVAAVIGIASMLSPRRQPPNMPSPPTQQNEEIAKRQLNELGYRDEMEGSSIRATADELWLHAHPLVRAMSTIDWNTRGDGRRVILQAIDANYADQFGQ